jgi:sucrose-6-phosphate hydrolase SacC (GH32 family)
MNNWEYAKEIPANPSRGSMTIPRELSLVTIDGEITLIQNPVKEILNSGIGDETFVINPGATPTGIRFTRGDGATFDIGYDSNRKEIYIDRTSAWFDVASTSIHAAPFDAKERSFEIRVITDAGSVELFVDGGRLSITDLVLPGDTPWVASPF